VSPAKLAIDMMQGQSEILFTDGTSPDLHLPNPRAGFYREVTAV